MCAPIAERSIATTPRWRLTKHARRNANFTTLPIANNPEQRFSAPSSNRFDSVASSASAFELLSPFRK